MSDDRLMTPKQVEFLRTLAVETMGEGDATAYLAQLRSDHPRPTAEQASAWISELKERKAHNPITAPPKARGGLPSVAAGRYALTAEDGSTMFYKVDRPSEGKFAGWTFVKWIRDNGYESALKKPQAETVLAKIAENPMDALVAYGRETGVCGVCGRTLRDPDSVAAGIGPVCASKVGS